MKNFAVVIRGMCALCSTVHTLKPYRLFLSNAWRNVQVLGNLKMESISQD